MHLIAYDKLWTDTLGYPIVWFINRSYPGGLIHIHHSLQFDVFGNVRFVVVEQHIERVFDELKVTFCAKEVILNETHYIADTFDFFGLQNPNESHCSISHFVNDI